MMSASASDVGGVPSQATVLRLLFLRHLSLKILFLGIVIIRPAFLRILSLRLLRLGIFFLGVLIVCLNGLGSTPARRRQKMIPLCTGRQLRFRVLSRKETHHAVTSIAR